MRLQLWQLLSCSIGILIALQPSYIHPDEHFQSLEVLAVKFFGIKGTVPWEFETGNAARSYVPLLISYGPLYLLITKVLRIKDPMMVLSLVRFQNFLIFTATCRWALKYLAKSSEIDSKKSLFFIETSYLSCSLQSHSFSNSLETILLLTVLAMYSELLSVKKNQGAESYRISAIIGILITLGIFNRMTFPAFILLPSITLFWYYYRAHLKSLSVLMLLSLASSLLFIYIDTRIYQASSFVIAPLNNLLYNLDETNLELHGLHPRYNHILLNIPQIVGPGILLLMPSRLCFDKITRKLPLLSIISGILLLSAFKHQELRFLLPLAPLIFIYCRSKSPFKLLKTDTILTLWLLFNIGMSVVMGIFHQSGVLLVLNGFYKENEPTGVHIWWKTYSPPTWMYMNPNLLVSTTKIEAGSESVGHIPFGLVNNHVVDLKGCDEDLLKYTVKKYLVNGASIKLIAPNSLKSRLANLKREGSFNFSKIEETKRHLDLDHFDLNDLTTFAPGISVYNVTFQDLQE